MSNKVCVVAGGCGFVGTHLCLRLLKEGCHVIALDNLCTTHSSNVDTLKRAAEDLPGKFQWVDHDISVPLPGDAISCEAVDEVYNLACPASPPHYQKDPLFTLRTGFQGTMNMLELAKKYDATMLQASTSEVYGDPHVHPQTEDYWGNVNPFGVRSCYDEGKRVGETLCLEYHRMHSVKIRVIRIFNTYGPYMHPFDGRVVSNFIRQALAGEDLTIYGEGQQTRSFQYVDDLIEGMLRMSRNPQGFIGPVNVGNPNEFTVKQLAEQVVSLTGAKSSIRHLPLPKDDPTQRQANISLAKRELDGWEPKVQLKEGLLKTVEYFKTVDMEKYKDHLQQLVSKIEN